MGLLRTNDLLSDSAEGEEEVVMKMIRLAAIGRDAVNIHAHEAWSRIRQQFNGSFFDDLTAGRIPDLVVGGFDVAAG